MGNMSYKMTAMRNFIAIIVSVLTMGFTIYAQAISRQEDSCRMKDRLKIGVVDF